MHVTLKLFLALIFLPVTLPAQMSPSDWVETLGDPDVGALVERIEEEEASLPPLSPLSEGWLESVEELGERLLQSGVHRSGSRYEESVAYLYARADWAGLPVERIKESRQESEALFAAVAGGPGERAVTATLLGAEEKAIEAGEAPESGALDALRRREVELLTRRSLIEKAAAAESIATGTELVVEMEDALSIADAPLWRRVAELFRDASGAVEDLTGGGDLDREAQPLRLDAEPRLGVPEAELLRVLGGASPALLEMALRWDGEIALGASLFFDRYRWSLAPLGAEARLGALLFVLQEQQRELYKRLFEGRLQERRESALISREQSASEELRQQLLTEAEGVLRRFEERSRRGDEESERWALLSVLSHPYAQTLLFREGGSELRGALQRRVRELYEEVDDRARELLGLVARRHAVADWEYLVTPLPNSFDRIVTVRFLPKEGAEVDAEVTEQLADAYYRAFNLVTNPEQNQDAPGQGVARWSMLHGQYLETRELRGDAVETSGFQGRFRDELEPWFLEAEREREPRGAFPFHYRGYQRLSYEQDSWLASTRERLPRRMAPLPNPDLLLAADLTKRFLDGEASLYVTERLLSYLLKVEILPPQFAWSEALEEARSWHTRTSSAETTAALLTLLSEGEGVPGEYAALTAVLESRLRRVLLLQELDLLDQSTSLERVYATWMENAASLLLRDGETGSGRGEEARIRRALTLPEEWQESGLLQAAVAEEFYRVLSREATRMLTTPEAETEAESE